MIDDGDVSDVHLTGFQHAGEHVQLIVGQESDARGINYDGYFAAVIA
jgi:hypothetical protein